MGARSALCFITLAISACNAARSTLRTRPLEQNELCSLAIRGFCVAPEWISCAHDVERISQDVRTLREEGLLQGATVGTGDAARPDDAIRRSSVLGLMPGPAPGVGDFDTRLALSRAVDSLRAQLATEPALAHLEELTPFETELAYLHYPPGGYYTRHVDVPAANEGWRVIGRDPADGTSLHRRERRRTLSMLLYVNGGWRDEWGGQLRIYTDESNADDRSGTASADGSSPCQARGGGGAHARGITMSTSAPVALQQGRDAAIEQRLSGAASGTSSNIIDVVPQGGTLVLFRSDLIEHEVLPTARDRQCVVGWFRTLRTSAWGGADGEGGSQSVAVADQLFDDPRQCWRPRLDDALVQHQHQAQQALTAARES